MKLRSETSASGKSHADSEFIIAMFSKDFNIDIDAHLTASDRGISRMLQRMLGEGSVFCNIAWRFYLSDNGKIMANEVLGSRIKAAILGSLVIKRIRNNMWGQGITRLSKDQILKLYFDDLQAGIDKTIKRKVYCFYKCRNNEIRF